MTHFRMTGRALRLARERLGLSCAQLASALSMTAAGGAEIEALEAQPARDVPGPLGLAVQALSEGWRPPHIRGAVALQIAA